MTQNKTKPTQQEISVFIDGIEDERTRADCRELLSMMHEVTGEPPTMWGPSMVGFGSYHYRYASGHEGDSFLTGFSPRKQALTVYVISGFEEHPALMARLGKFKTGKSCLYIKNLDAIDRSILTQLVTQSVALMRKKYPAD